jgi:hypothetical protein
MIYSAEEIIHHHCQHTNCELLGESYSKRKFTPTKHNLKIEICVHGIFEEEETETI